MATITRFSVPPLFESTRLLAAVARGETPPDLIIRHARVLSTYSETILPEREIWIAAGRIAAVQPAGTAPPGRAPAEYDAQGGILAPGLVDAHVHIESSMITACAYAEAALLNGTTTIFCDSHEIGNVLDVAGVEMMLEDARQAPLSIFLTLPSTVPATHGGLETAGGDLTPEKIGQLFDRWPEAVALGEKMDFVPVALGDPRSHAIIRAALQRGRPVCGHVYGHEFVAAYAASGVTDTHEAIDAGIAQAFIEAGLWVFLRGGPPGSPWDSLPHAIEAITGLGLHPKRFCLCTDDRDPADLFPYGLDYVAREAVQAGLAPATAWSLGSLHAATRYAMDGEIGGLGHSRRADLVLLNDALEVQNTWYGGTLLVKDKRITPALEEALSQPYAYPPRALATVILRDDYAIVPEPPTAAAQVNLIELGDSLIVTKLKKIAWEPSLSVDDFMQKNRLCYVTVIERHGRGGTVGHSFLQNFGLHEAAVASTVGHDAHNLIVAGTNAADMRVAVETLRRCQGGVCVVRAGSVLALVELPIAGLLSAERAPIVAEKVTRLKQVWSEIGCTLPYMGFNLLPLSVIPEIRLTDRGLVKVPEMTLLPLYES